MIERRIGTVVVEGPQGVGKTSLVVEASKYSPDIKTARGIPDNTFLSSHREAEIWQEALRIFNDRQSDCDCRIFDRSILSLVAYNLRKHPHAETLIFNLGWSYLNRMYQVTPNILLLVIDAEIEKCFERQPTAKEGFKICSPVEMEAEAKAYQKLAGWLVDEGFIVEQLENNASWGEFLEQACLRINRFFERQ